ncbi:MAG: Bug family tripartite tricarboxylate transporter substrate binding protein [Burkholderiales bacterium]
MSRLAVLFSIATWTLLANAAGEPAFPHRPIRLVTSEVGGSADIGARLLAQGLTGRLGQQVIVDNRGSGIIPGDIVSRARPDGYTLLFFGGTFWLQPLLRKNVPYDPVRDFAPITQAVISPTILVVHPSLPAHSVKELIALAKAKPGELNYAMGSPGSSNHIGAELFKAMAGLDIVGVGYKGNGPAVGGLLASQVQLMFATGASVMGHMKSGRLRGLAVGSANPSPVAPDLPTIAASGLPGYESISITALFAPAKTPQAIVDRLNRESAGYLMTAEAKERFLNTGAEAASSSPEELGARVKSEIAKMGKVIRNAGIRAQ